MMKRFEIQVLLRAGHTQAEVARLTGIPERTVRRVQAEAAVASVDDGTARERRGIGRPSKAERFRPFVTQLFAEEPGLRSVEMLRRAKLKGYDGGKTAFYDLVAAVRPTVIRPLVRFEGLPGEFTQHDFGEVDVRFLDGSRRRVHFFASRLKYSRFVQVSLVPDQRVESLVRNLVDHFAAMGGVPLLAVFDRPKTVAIAWAKDGTVTEWNESFAHVMLELGVGIEVCWPGRGNQKGAVENLVGWVKGSFFKSRRFHDEADLLEQLAQWHAEVNTQRPSRATGVIPGERLREEQPRLRPLKVAPADLALRVPIYVGPTATVVHDTHPYSMPPEAIGISGTLFLYRDRVRIVAGRYEAVHLRLFERGARSTLPEHRAQLVAAVSGKRAKRYLQREQLLELGPPALEYLTEIVHRRPRAWVSEVEALHALLQQHGAAPLREAFVRALAQETFGTEYDRHYLHETASTSPPSGAALGVTTALTPLRGPSGLPEFPRFPCIFPADQGTSPPETGSHQTDCSAT
jgi:transposase